MSAYLFELKHYLKGHWKLLLVKQMQFLRKCIENSMENIPTDVGL